MLRSCSWEIISSEINKKFQVKFSLLIVFLLVVQGESGYMEEKSYLEVDLGLGSEETEESEKFFNLDDPFGLVCGRNCYIILYCIFFKIFKRGVLQDWK